jgi:heptosyltransferase-1
MTDTLLPTRILIIKPSSLGDVIHALPTVSAIRRQFPHAHIAWLVNAELTSLLEHSPVIDRVIPFPRRDFAAIPALLRQLRREQFDVALDLQGLLRSGLIARASGAPRRVGLSDSREGARLFHTEIVTVPRCHAITRYLLAARHLGCPESPVEFPIGITRQPRSGGWIAVNPSARWPTKLWGDELYAELVRRLPHDRVVLTGSASERARIDHIAQGRRNMAGQTNLLELAELYGRCAVVITNDTGPMHLAAAVGTPVIAIFGPTDPLLTGPHGNRHILLRAPIPCSPCFRRHCMNPVKMDCMRRISLDQVWAALEPFLQSPP